MEALNFRVLDTDTNQIIGIYTDKQDAEIVCKCYNDIEHINRRRITRYNKRYIVLDPVINELLTIDEIVERINSSSVVVSPLRVSLNHNVGRTGEYFAVQSLNR